ncbi:MAG: hypothetical protein HY331_17300 [Chloroflexi bacterium]|nr:hypothetical protein [Chloroflexota bacterium]
MAEHVGRGLLALACAVFAGMLSVRAVAALMTGGWLFWAGDFRGISARVLGGLGLLVGLVLTFAAAGVALAEFDAVFSSPR